ncbi:MAG TPA: glycosyl transferase family protein [Acetobacteraceae bacterium]|nr:glycosyl transferase family protein [Acetobacteraceae bacterium]
MTPIRPDRFAPFVATLGRGPGRSRALTREEAREAFALILAGEVDPIQLGAFLMLLRYRGEDAAEIAGLVEAAQAAIPRVDAAVMLDWPSYGAGRTRGAPWFLLAALALARAGVRVLMHGSNAFSAGTSVASGLAALGLAPAADEDGAAVALARDQFAYLPLATLAPELARLIGLRRLFGLRSPVNTVVRLLDPGRAPAGIDGVFHPAYMDVHLRVAELLARPRLLVLKGGGGEAELVPIKPAVAHLWSAEAGRSTLELPAWPGLGAAAAPEPDPAALSAVWRGDVAPARPVATVRATIALGLLALGTAATPAAAEREAARVWAARR